MEISTLKGRLSNEIIESLTGRGITRLTPPQRSAMESGLLEGANLIVASPTASGKTLIAEIAALNAVLGKRKKAIYVAPLRALTMEKYEEFSVSYPYVKTAISIGELDSNDQWLAEYEMLFFSTEKLDSLIRHGVSWLSEVGCIIFDEIHMLGNNSRGPTLELLITKLANICDAQIIGLSATIENADELSEWLHANLVQSDYRPVPLKAGIVCNGSIIYDKQNEPLQGSDGLQEVRVAQDTLKRSKQLLVFYATKRNTEAGAARLAEHVYAMLDDSTKQQLQQIADRVANVLQSPTDQCIKLSALVAKGVVFHHAGLLNAQRKLIEEAFKSNLIKVICATTTLSLGVNLPAHTVLVRDVTRYSNGGSEYIEVSEVKQLFGRAGRPKYDTEGRALLLATSIERAAELRRRYIDGKQEPIESRLGVVPVLRTHLLAFISENFLNNAEAIERFLGKSFYGFQFRDTAHIRGIIDQVIEELISWDFITIRNRVYNATKLGKRVSELYIDPLSAHLMVESLGQKLDTTGLLFTITNTLEMRPHVKANPAVEEMLVSYMHAHKFNSLIAMEDFGYEPERAFATALMLKDWIGEEKEKQIVKTYSTTAGEFYNKLSTADWMLYAASELSRLLGVSTHDLINLRVRMRYGIKEELMDLIRLKQVGRVRARMLYSNGITTIEDLRANAPVATKLFGSEVAKRIVEQL